MEEEMGLNKEGTGFWLSPMQMRLLFAEDRRINILTGSVRSGKTWVSLLKWALFVASAPDTHRFLMAGKTIGTLNRNCLEPLAEIVGEKNFEYSIHSKQGKLFGRTIWLEDANDAQSEHKIRGLTLGGAYLDELTLMRREFYNMLLSRLSVQGARLYATTNPDAPSHWVMEEAIKKPGLDIAVWEFRLTDNPFLPEEYVENIKKEYSGVFYDRYILGLWTACEGLIYRRFAEERGSFLKDEAPRFNEISIGVDFGGSRSGHAFVAVGFGESGAKKTVFALASERHFGDDIDPARLYRLILAFADRASKKYGAHDCVISICCDAAEPVLIRGLRRAATEDNIANIVVRAAKKHKILDRIRVTLSFMAQGRFFYTHDCKTLVSALENAVWSEARADERLDDGRVDVDTLDAFEYAWARELERL